MDVLSDLLRTFRLSGTAFIDASLAAPWAIQTPTATELGRHLASGNARIIPYHLVSEGHLIAELSGATSLDVQQGEVVMFPHGDVHSLSSQAGLSPLRITTDAVMRLTKAGSISKTTYNAPGPRTEVLCGFFACDRTLSDRFIDQLPRMFKFSFGNESAAVMLQIAARQSGVGSNGAPRPGTGAVLCKLSELLFVEGLRSYMEMLPEQEVGWIAGLKNPLVGRVLATIHGSPERAWTLESLASATGTSRSTLNEHFVRCMGQTPMQYLVSWRLRLAADSLTTSSRRIKQVAADAGFGSTAAFSRAFKRELGATPAAWVAQREGR